MAIAACRAPRVNAGIRLIQPTILISPGRGGNEPTTEMPGKQDRIVEKITIRTSENLDAIKAFSEARDIPVGHVWIAQAIRTSVRQASCQPLFLRRYGGDARKDKTEVIEYTLLRIATERGKYGHPDPSEDQMLEMLSSRAFGRFDPSMAPIHLDGELPRFLNPALAGSYGIELQLLAENLLIDYELPTSNWPVDRRVISLWVHFCAPLFRAVLEQGCLSVAEKFPLSSTLCKDAALSMQELCERAGGVKVKLGHCYDLIAIASGCKNWNVLSAQLRALEDAQVEISSVPGQLTATRAEPEGKGE
ncbi:hypothetical protein ACEUZ9_002896 [Paracoccus litorisediminis]|uniref:hypothetical protein n=1 Tax=Paracoccus litorisediminis TaxID=2006130 RepID=UPI00372E2381